MPYNAYSEILPKTYCVYRAVNAANFFRILYKIFSKHIRNDKIYGALCPINYLLFLIMSEISRPRADAT